MACLPKQPLVLLPLLVGGSRQTPLRDANVLSNVLNQGFLGHVVVLRAYVAQDDQREGGAVEVLGKRVQDVYLDAALRVLVVRVVAYAQDRRVDLGFLVPAWGHGAAWGRGGGRFQVGYCVVGASLWDRRVACGARHAQLGGKGGYCAVVERGVAVVDARFKVVVSADAEAGERDVGRGDAEVFGAAPEAFDDGPTQLEWEWRLDGCTQSVLCAGDESERHTVRPGDGVAGSIWAAHVCRVHVLRSGVGCKTRGVSAWGR